MKKLLVILVSVLGLTVFSQNRKLNIDKDIVIKEFVRLLDSIKTEKNKKYSHGYVFKTKIDSMGSLACSHHNRYMRDMVPKKGTDMIITHDEVTTKKLTEIYTNWNTNVEKTVEKTYTYHGNDTLIDDFPTRYRYFSKNTFASFGECCLGGYVNYVNEKYDNQRFALFIIDCFDDSKPHWEILTEVDYTSISIDLLFDEQNLRFWVTVATGKDMFTKENYLTYVNNFEINKQKNNKKKSLVNRVKNIFR